MSVRKIKPLIRLLEYNDILAIVRGFHEIGWKKPAEQYERYLMEQSEDLRAVYVAFLEGQFAGYLTICWISSYKPFRDAHIPETVDFNVLPKFRRQGIGTQLMEKAENLIARVNSIAGIAVGMDADYGAAQRLYILRGYIPDGRGLQYRDHAVKYGERVTVDDALALYLTKELKSSYGT